MKKYIGVALLAFVFAVSASAQVARPAKEERIARKAEKREMKSNNRLKNSDRKKDRKAQKEEDKRDRKPGGFE